MNTDPSPASRPAHAAPPAGPVIGTIDDGGVHAFLGIPYAEPPIGSLRFEPPAPRRPWTEPLDATTYGATAPQHQSAGPVAALLPTAIIPGNDFLNLNVWTPDPTANLPVMVFVHGGSWTTGSGAVDIYNGTGFARDGVVLVTINYRLGVDGFLWFGDGPANLGLLDQIAALTWVRDNIAAFGGDPNSVTIFGESAGAMSIGALLAMPAAAGLFQRAILESGAAHHAVSAESARLVATRVAAILEVAPTRDAIATETCERILSAQAQVTQEVTTQPRRKLWGDVATTMLPFAPVIDGDTLPERPLTAIQHGSVNDIDILIGNNTEEALLLLAPAGVDTIRRWHLPLAAIRVGIPPIRGTRFYRQSRPTARPGDLLSDMLTDWLYRIPAVRIADAHSRTHVYEFAWRSPRFDGELGACHAMELPFVFDTLRTAGAELLTGPDAPQPLADSVHRAWVRFATSGNPGWHRYGPERTVMHFDATPHTVINPGAETRRLWEGRR